VVLVYGGDSLTADLKVDIVVVETAVTGAAVATQ